VKRVATTVAILAFASSAAHAAGHYRYHRTYAAHHYSRYAARAVRPVERHVEHTGGGIVTINTAANPITLAADVAQRFKELIDDLVAAGFKGDVHCLASRSNPSFHPSGRACDFAQTGRNATVPIMYRAGEIIARHGLHDGCSFHDCGHVDLGGVGVAYRTSADRRVATQDKVHDYYAAYDRIPVGGPDRARSRDSDWRTFGNVRRPQRLVRQPGRYIEAANDDPPRTRSEPGPLRYAAGSTQQRRERDGWEFVRPWDGPVLIHGQYHRGGYRILRAAPRAQTHPGTLRQTHL
jgi:hypothetical protein